MKKELEWVRQNPKARQAKSKARLARFEELSDYEYQKRNETQEIFIPVADRLGNEVIEFTSVSKSFGDRLLIDNLSFKVPAGAIVGIIGPNGAGKSTLFKLIGGKEQPDSGEVKIGSTVKMAFVDQRRDELENEKTVWEDISGGLDIITVGKFQMASRAYAGRFNFNGGDQQKRVGTLSGGERGRLHLAKTLIASATGPGTYEYRFFLNVGSNGWNEVQPFSTLPTWTRNTNGATSGTDFVGVQIRQLGSTIIERGVDIPYVIQ